MKTLQNLGYIIQTVVWTDSVGADPNAAVLLGKLFAACLTGC